MSVVPARDVSPPHLAQIADCVRRVTVEIYSPGAGGAGIIWGPDLVVTNAHVARASRLRVGLADEANIDAHVIAADRRADLALIRNAFAPVPPGARRWIHADVRLAPGNSGGPLDTAGHVVGSTR